MNDIRIEELTKIKKFLDGHNELKYVVNIEANPDDNFAECIIHPPNSEKRIEKIEYEPFMYVKDLKKLPISLYYGDKELEKQKRIQYGIKFEKLKTGGQKRLIDGYCYKVTSYKSFNSILNYFKDAGVNPYEKQVDDNGKFIKNNKGDYVYIYRDLFFNVKPYEQFMINTGIRLYKGFEEYKHIHKLIFDIETTGLRYEITRVFSIGIKDNRGFEKILEVEKPNDDEAEKKLIVEFFDTIIKINPAIIGGYNSEEFDFDYLLNRAKLLGLNIDEIRTTLNKKIGIKRRRANLKYGSNSDKYTATIMWGFSIIDIMFASKRTKAINSEIKKTNLKYIAKFEKIAKENRTYIKGEDNSIGRYYHENPMFMSNDKNQHIEVPNEFKDVTKKLYKLQEHKNELSEEKYSNFKKQCLKGNKEFIKWFKNTAAPQKMTKFITGKKLVRKYLLDDLWETEQVDEKYNQSSFMLAKIIPTSYSRITTMGNAAIWNLLMTTWSYENNLAIPHSDEQYQISGGLSRCFKKGYTERLIKIDYASLYPMLQLTWDIFPIFDITNIMKLLLLYMTTTRNIYKKLGRDVDLQQYEVELMKGIDTDGYSKYINSQLSDKDRGLYKIKELPIKIINNSLFGALGSNVAFNWSDNDCAYRITCSGRIELRHAINWFDKYKCTPLYCVTDGVNFQIPDNTNIKVDDTGVYHLDIEKPNEEMWSYKGKIGIEALIEKFNDEEMKGYMSVDDDGQFISCFNLARINYAVLEEKKNKETNEVKRKIKYTGNSIKSSVMPEYVEDFYDKGFEMILNGKGYDFVEYYYDYAQKIYYKQIPIKKIASKSKYKNTIKQYLNRGTDKNGNDKAKQAHMELIISEREEIANKLFEEHKNNLDLPKPEDKLDINDKMKLIDVYMPPEPELDSTIFYYNTGYRKSHGDSVLVKDKETGEYRYASKLLDKEMMVENPDMIVDYNSDKYLDAFNKKVVPMLHAFNPEIAKKIPVKIKRKKVKDEQGNKVEQEDLVINHFTREELELKNFDLDDLNEAMYLEDMEINYWVKSGYNPKLIWDGFELNEQQEKELLRYEKQLEHLNELMLKSNKPLIKNKNEKPNKGDLILLKFDGNYSLGQYNGKYIKIIKESKDIPLCEYEKQFINNNKGGDDEVEKLKSVDLKSEKEKGELLLKEKRKKYYIDFSKKFNIPFNTYEEFIIEVEDGNDLLDEFILLLEEEENEQLNQYTTVD